jgi:hypothetical protein
MSNARRTTSRIPKPEAAAPKIEIGPDRDAYGRPDWTRYNATVVGANPLPGATAHPAELPGIAEARARGLAAQAAYYATRKTYEYDDDEEGWQQVKRKSRGRRRRQQLEEDA